MIWKAQRLCMAGWALALSLLLVSGSTAQAQTPLVPLKVLLAVEDPAASGLETAAPSSNRVEDKETPAGLSGEPALPTEPDASQAVKKKALPTDSEEESVFKTWWFWALTAAVVGGTVALGVWASESGVEPAGPCSPTAIACFGDGR